MSQTELKRKSTESPEGQVPQQRLRRRGSLPELSRAAEQTEGKRAFSLQELFHKSFSDPQILTDITPVIVDTLKPGITAAVEAAVAGIIPTVIKDALNAFKTEVMDPVLEMKENEIKELKAMIHGKDENISSLEKEVHDLKFQHNELAQYGRRCNIRLNNVQLADESQCEEVVVQVLNNILKANRPATVGDPEQPTETTTEEKEVDTPLITADDIERCHPLGKPNKKGNRQIIVKFKSYKSKASVYSAKAKLRPYKIFMTEDFTPDNQKLISRLLQLKQSDTIVRFWTIDGRIFAKTSETASKVQIRRDSDIRHMLDAVGEWLPMSEI